MSTFASARHLVSVAHAYRRAWTIGEDERADALEANLRAIRAARPSATVLVGAILDERTAEAFRAEDHRAESARRAAETKRQRTDLDARRDFWAAFDGAAA